MDNKRGFASRLGFIMSMAAFSIGIGNLWKFPYVVGNNGGGAFLLIYLLMVVLVGFPGFLIEITLGRSAQLSPVAGMRRLEGKKKTPWIAIGIVGCAAIFIIVSYATTIVGGWTLGYIVKVIDGSLSGLSAEEIANVFGGFSGNPKIMIYAAVEVLLLWVCLVSGVKKGVEKICSILLPLLFVIMIGLAVYSNVLPGAFSGLMWYLTPDFSAVTASGIAAAATQVLFSIGIGMCCAYVYGSYITKNSNMVKSVALTAVLDTLVAVLAGLICVPALFAFGIEPTAGPSLIYITLPHLFNEMGSFGNVFGAVFMLCVFFAGFTSILGGSEALVAVLCDSGKMQRKAAATLVVVAQFLFGFLFTLSFGGGIVSKFRALGMGLFDFFDFISSACLCLGALLMVLYVVFRWGFDKFREEANQGSSGVFRIRKWMKGYFCFVYPVVLVIVIYCIISGYLL